MISSEVEALRQAGCTFRTILSQASLANRYCLMRFTSEKTVAFCHMYEFSGAKGASVTEITSYLIETK